jgi:cystatin-C
MADRGTLAGGITEVPQEENDLGFQEIFRFAVDEHNKKP